MNKPYPFRFHPIYKEKVWGGTALSKKFGRVLPSSSIGESWEVSAHAQGVSIVANGPLAGTSLTELVSRYGRDLIGTALPDSALVKFPLLLKILDANDYLSVQVHPDDEYAADHESGDPGKWEAWYVIAADPGAEIIYGLKPGATREALKQAVARGTLASYLNRVPVKPGDVFDVPAGTVHALGRGVMVAEIQQNSDTVYRLYDWDRVDAEGNTRPLHIKKALDVIQFAGQRTGPAAGVTIPQPAGQRSVMVANRYFALEILSVDGTAVERTNGERFFLFTCLDGSLGLEDDLSGTYLALKPGDSVLVPACVETYRLTGTGKLMKCYVPDIRRNIIEPLMAHGYSYADITSLVAGLGDYRTSYLPLG
ncbi:MAG TPA: class I mannose-6-phosphate isomerase [Firmicutes bacterium]|nr:class I mannose-6-phosphate isomerase [Bacillota bacterium]